jgi:hypothetical protein
MQNFNAGVGQRYYLLFNVSSVPGVNVNQAYMMFTVSQYDNYSYLFYQPTFISLDSTAKPTSIPVSGMRIGINGTIPLVGQAYIPLSTTITAASYSPTAGDILSSVGTVIGLENGPLTDQFFLQFDTLGTAHDVIVEATPQAATLALGPPAADFGVRTFAQVNSTFSQLTGVPTSNASVVTTYQSVQQQLPAINTIEAYSAANQVGVAQLAVQYCNQVMLSPSLQQKIFPGVNFASLALPSGAGSITGPLTALAVGTTGTNAQRTAVQTELGNLVTNLCTSIPCNNPSRVSAVTVGVCAAALGNANVLID